MMCRASYHFAGVLSAREAYRLSEEIERTTANREMAMKRVINGVHIIPMGFANAFLIEGDDGLTLIDAGFPRKEATVFGAIRELGHSSHQLKYLIFTHGHPDHIGSAAAIVLVSKGSEKRDGVDDFLCGHNSAGVIRDIDVERGVHHLI